MQTRRDLEVSTDDVGAIAAIDSFTDRLARIAPGSGAVGRDADAHPGVGQLQLYTAMLWLYAQTDDATTTADRYLERLATLDTDLNDRERTLKAALVHWRARRYLAAAEVLEQSTRAWPTDLVSVKALEYLYFVLGQQHTGERSFRHFESLASANAGDPDFLAVYAFAAELSGRADRAESLVDEALAIETSLPWAHHALAHVLVGRGDDEGALARLAGYLPVSLDHDQFIRSHNAWHVGLVHLDRLDPGAAIDLYDEHIWGYTPDLPTEQVDAISLLRRVELAGSEVADSRWAVVADHVESRAGECYHPFLSAHHAIALARAGRTESLTRLLTAVRTRSAATDDEARRVWNPVGRSVVEACAAHGSGDAVRAAERFDEAIDDLTAVGGSDAQNDLFRQTYLDALIAGGRPADARRYWQVMTGWKTTSPLDEKWLERI
jgi:tetratricopeptide (TPR) repeat protein